LNKKLSKKNKFNVGSPVEVYKTEFVKNAELTLYKNVLDFKNLSTSTSGKCFMSENIKTNNSLLFLHSDNIAITFLKKDKSNFLSRLQSFGKRLIFIDELNDNILEEHSIRKYQPAVIWRKSPGKKLIQTTKL
jgi:hypothetical protein